MLRPPSDRHSLLNPSVFSRGSVRIGMVFSVFLFGLSSMSLADTIWCSEFETESGVAVSHDQVAEVVDNNSGAAGTALGSAPGFNPLIYVEYGQAGVPAIPSAIDPNGAGLSFAVSTPDDPATGINTNLPSDTGNAANAVSFEGYFFTPESEAITDPSFVGRRLVTQKRSANDGESRLAVGLHAEVTPAAGLLDYEGFNYSGTVLADRTGGTGWGGPWLDGDGDFAILSNDDTSLDISGTFPFTPVGDRITGGMAGATAEGVRAISQPVSMGDEGATLYLSYLTRKHDTSPSSANNTEVSFDNGSSSQIVRSGTSSSDFFFLALAGGATTVGTTPVIEGETYFVVVKITASAEADDVATLAFFQSGDTVPALEGDVTWEVTATGDTGGTLARLRMVLGANAGADFDEIRVGTSYESVTDPAAVSTPGSFKNLLSVFWKETSPDPLDPDAGDNHLELGTTEVLPNTWYHFACTYDGTDIRWYLDGTLEGEVLNPDLIDPGTGRFAVGNNRTSGANGSRGFFGLLDEVRIYEAALAAGDLLANGGDTSTGLLWQSRFETELGQPVTHGQEAIGIPNAIDNTVGPPHGTMAGIVALTYAAYAEASMDPVPALIDPAALSDAFALTWPDLRIGVVNTNLQSDVGNLANAMTVQGYFNTFDSDPITDASFVGRRFVSTKRSSSDGQSRLAIGLHAFTPPPTDGLFDYEGFDYAGTALDGGAGGIGWTGGWIDGDGNFAHLTDDDTSLDSAAYPFTPVGDRLMGADGDAVRLMSVPVDLSVEGNAMFVSCLMRKTSVAATSAEDIQLQFFDNANNMRFRIAVGSDEQFLVQAGGSGNTQGPDGTMVAGETYFLVGKVVSHDSEPDEGFLAIFGPGDTVPTTEAGIVWDLTHASTTGVTLDRLRINFGVNNVDAELDEIRIGSTYASVTDPDAPVGGPSDPYNVVAVYYHDGASQLALGTTEILPNVWHHFGLVYDGADIRWYLDGALEGQVTSVALTPPGTANIGVGNSRTAGDGVRGFYGMLDKVVIEDTVRDPADFMTAGIDPCGVSCNHPFADADGDGDVDQMDFAIAQLCSADSVLEGCECYDRDLDNDVDGADFQAFGDCATGPEVLWTQDATPLCVP